MKAQSKIKSSFSFYSASAFSISAALLSNQTFALSLDEAVNEQLALGPLPCAALSAGVEDNNNRFTDGLLAICSAVIPAGAVGDSGGGGSATPISVPNIMQNVANTALGDNSKNTGSNNNSNQYAINNEWGLFFTAETETLDKNKSEFSQGFESDRTRFIFGASYSASTKSVYSLAFDINQHEGDFKNGGGFDNDSQGLRFLSSFRPSNNTFVNVLAGFDSISATQERSASFDYLFNNVSIFSASGSLNAKYDYDQLGINIEAGKDIQIGQYTFSPSVGLNWNTADYGTYNEAGISGLELVFYDDEEESLQSTIGITSSAILPTSFGTLNPQFALHWHHEFEADSRTADVSFTGDTLAKRFSYQTEEKDADFFNLSAGFTLVFKSGLQGFVNVQTLVGHEYYDNTIASIGIRYEL